MRVFFSIWCHTSTPPTVLATSTPFSLSLSLLQSPDSFVSLIAVCFVSVLSVKEESGREREEEEIEGVGKGREDGGEREEEEGESGREGEKKNERSESVECELSLPLSLSPYYGPLLFSLLSSFGRKEDGFAFCSFLLFLSLTSCEWAGASVENMMERERGGARREGEGKGTEEKERGRK